MIFDLRRLIISLFGLAFVAFEYTTCQGNSPCKGTTVNNICYEIDPQQSKTWEDASAYCQEYGGQLASITSLEIQNSIAQLASSLNVASGLWIGAIESLNLFEDRVWQWTDGTKPAPQGCYNENPSEREMTQFLSPTLMSPFECMTNCSRVNYKYAGVQNKGLCFCGNTTFGNYGISTLCNEKCSVENVLTMWCGGEDINHIYDVSGNYAQWGKGQPNNFNNYQHCAVLDKTLSDFKFADERCSKSNYYICRALNRNVCSGTDGEGRYYTGHITGNCYYISTNVTRLTWYLAREKCKVKGTSLVNFGGSIDMASEIHIELKKILMESWKNEMVNYNTAKLWIGLSRTKWTWVNGEPLQYTNWDLNQPNSAEELCLIMESSQTWRWSDDLCSRISNFVCQDANLPIVTTTTTTTVSTTTVSTTTVSTTTGNTPGNGGNNGNVDSGNGNNSSNSNGNNDTPDAVASTGDSALSNVEIVLIVVVIVMAVIAALVVLLLCIYCCKKKERKVDASSKDYYSGIMHPSTISDPMDTGRSSITDYSSKFIDINDSTDFFTGSGYQMRY